MLSILARCQHQNQQKNSLYQIRGVFLVKLFCVLLWICPSAFCQTVKEFTSWGDSAYSLRRDGQIDQAISYYNQALIIEPDNFLLNFKLIEALYFKGYHVSTESSEKEEIFSKVLNLSEHCLDLLSKAAEEDLRNLTPKKQASLVKELPYSAETYFWSSISWGLWGMTFGNLASARKSVATKVRDYATVLMLVNPHYASGAGYRLLGRLHTVAPKIPFFTFWINREYGIKLLSEANKISISDPRNQLFLAEALLDYETEKKAQAIKLLEQVSQREPSNEYYLEQLESITAARNRLKELRADE